ncbi:MAG: Crp/Fnr family transcriptional regulator [Dehalococcoidia bacterium]|nr:Crp/Fnr family transcriptional regulator [Dehalococcoidia bacterium]
MTPASIDDVRKVAYFQQLDDERAKRFARELVVRQYRPRERILTEGDQCEGFFLLRSGRARIFRTGPEGREQILRLLQPGDTFGEVPVFDGESNPASVEAIEPAEAVLFPTHAVNALVDEDPQVAKVMLRHIARRLRGFTELVEQISLQTVQNRLARYLYFAAREEGIETEDGIRIPRSITQQDLAALVGTVREVVGRTLRAMEEEGIIEVRRKEFVVRDMAALRLLL